MNIFDLTNLIKNNTCITGTHKSLIDIILTNKQNAKRNLQHELRVSDFHKMPITILQAQVACLKPKEISFRSYKNFNENKFLINLNKRFSDEFIEIDKTTLNSDEIYNLTVDILKSTLDQHAPVKL